MARPPSVRPAALLPGATAALAAFAILAAAPVPPATAAETEPVTIRFKAAVGNQPFACGRSYDGIGTAGSRITPSDFRFYVSEIALIDAGGRAVPMALDQDGRWQHQSVALLDFENKTGPCANGTAETREIVTGTVPAGRYDGLRFTLGVPFALNHADATIAPSPLNLTSLFWSWQGGYKFLRVDFTSAVKPAESSDPAASGQGHHAPADGGQGFVIHLGSTGCGSAGPMRPPASCDHPNRPLIEFAHFDPPANVVVADLKALLAGTDVDANRPGTQAGCMSDPDDSNCAAIMWRLGLPFGGVTPATQTFLRVE